MAECRKRLESRLRETNDPRLRAAETRINDELARRVQHSDVRPVSGREEEGTEETQVAVDATAIPAADRPHGVADATAIPAIPHAAPHSSHMSSGSHFSSGVGPAGRPGSSGDQFPDEPVAIEEDHEDDLMGLLRRGMPKRCG